MIPYILYAAIILTACFIFYKVLLQKETFFHLNRMILLACMMLAFALPLIKIPAQLSLRKTAAPAVATLPAVGTTIQESIIQSVKQKQHAAVAQPVINNSAINMDNAVKWLGYLYWFGVIVFGINFLMQAIILLRKAYSFPVIKDGRFRIVEITGDKAPCSFANNIFINPEKYDWETYNQVLLHEKIHIEQRHTLDLMLAEIVIIFQWFNPFAWAWRKELENNLEYYTDENLLRHNSVEKENYQVSLVKVAAPHFPLSLTTNYNQSMLKKRLVMMNAKKSSVHTIWKYFFLAPLMIVLVCFFNETSSYAQKSSAANSILPVIQNGPVNMKGVWFATIKNGIINFQFRNDDNDNNFTGNSFSISEIKDLPMDKSGKFFIERDAGTMEFTGKFEGNKGMGDYNFVPAKAYAAQMNSGGIDMKSDNDAIVFFLLNIKASYLQMLKNNGFKNITKEELIPLAALNVDEQYINSIKKTLPAIELNNLVPFKSLNIDEAYIDDIKKAGYKNITADKIITFKAQGIDGKLIADFKSSSSDNNGKEEALAAQQNELNMQQEKLNEQQNKLEEEQNLISEQQNKEDEKNADRNASKHNDEDDIIAMKVMGVDEQYISSFKQAGLKNIKNEDLIAFKTLGVTAEFVKSFKAAGLNIGTEDIAAYKTLGITADFVRSFSSAGFTVKSDDMAALKTLNITPSLLKEYKAFGFADATIDNIAGAKAIGATPDYINKMRANGHNFKSLEKYISLKALVIKN